MIENQPGRAETIRQAAEEIRKMNLFNNTFMSTAMRDREACEYVLRKILRREDLELTSASTQWVLPNLTSKDSYLDVFAENERENVIYNLEDQRKDTKEHAKRTRYYGAMIDKSNLDKGTEYNVLPDVYVIYISETDIWKFGKTMYEVDYRLKETGTLYEDGTHRIYVNGAVDDGSDVAKMMQYFKTADPDDMSQGALSKRVRYLKSDWRGGLELDEVAEKIYSLGEASGREEGREEGRAEGRKEGRAEGREEGREEGRAEGRVEEKRKFALRLYRKGDDVHIIADYVDADIELVCEWLGIAPVTA